MVRFLKSYTTHIPVLIKALNSTEGDVLELGSGLFSTPLLHWLCAESGRRLETFEDEKEYFDFANQFRSRNHKILFVEDWDKIDISKKRGVVFIDHKTERRSIDALRVNATYIILHDSETDTYGYSKVYPKFKYVYQYTFANPWTAVLSNTEDFMCSDFICS